MGLDNFLSDLKITASKVDAQHVARGNKRCFLESNDVWHQIDVARPSIMIPVSGSVVGVVIYTNNSPYPDTQVRPLTATGGVCYFFAPGSWWVKIGVAGSAAARVCFDVFDIGSDANSLTMLTMLQNAGVLPVNVVRYGGTVQTGADLGAYYATLTHGPLVGTVDAAHTVQARDSEWLSARAGRRFSLIHPIGSSCTAQATYVVTTPTVLVGNTAATTSCILRSLYVGVQSASAAAVNVDVVIDSIDRYVAATGTARTPQNTNMGSITAWPLNNAIENPTAAAASGNVRQVFRGTIIAGLGQSLSANFHDAIIISGAAQSLLVYIYDSAGLAAPSVIYQLDMEAY